MSETRRISEFLPEVIQTDVLRKFFAATADHMFQPDRVEYLNAYVGQLLSTYDPNKDARIPESNSVRQAYQVEPGLVSRNTQSNQISHILSYEDLINKLRWQGALVDDHNRLFESEYYSFGLPVDLDKLTNYTQYVWLNQGPQLIQLRSETNIEVIKNSVTYTYTGLYEFVQDKIQETGSLTFTSGLRVQFAKDVNVTQRDQVFVVEGVGRRIRLVPEIVKIDISWDQPDTWDSTAWDSQAVNDIPTYITIGRGSENGNPWSRSNRWFHKQVLELSRTSITAAQSQTAQRPILEFDHSIPLWDFGSKFLMDVDLVDTTRRNLDDVINKRHVQVDHVTLDDGQVVLFTNLDDASLNNRLYQVHGVRSTGQVQLNQLLTPGSGLPEPGSVIFVTQGGAPTGAENDPTYYQNVNTNWYFTGTIWKKGQSRQLVPIWNTSSAEYVSVLNQAPLFDLYDHAGDSLGNQQKYPNSSFAGCTLLSYAQNESAPRDTLLGFSPDVDSLSARNYKFDVTCAQISVTYYDSSTLTTVPGYYYWNQNFSGTSEYVNNWFLSDTLSRQYVVNEYVADGQTTEFVIDQQPDSSTTGAPSIQVQLGSRVLRSTEYTVSEEKVVLSQAPAAQTVVKVRSYAGLQNKTQLGYFEIPVNLKSNPDNQVIQQFSLSDILPHVHSILVNQTGFKGDVAGANNWRDSAQLLGRGTQIVQHTASMLKLMALNSVNQSQVFEGSQSITDPLVTMQWSQSEYLRYYNKFLNSLWGLYNNQALTGADDVMVWIHQAFKQINLGKTRSSAWVNSGVDMTMGQYCSQQSDSPTWVPTSATRLGAWPAWQPTVFYDRDSNQSGPAVLMMRCHNGALVSLTDLQLLPLGEIQGGASQTSDPNQLTHPVAKAWLKFEQLQFASLPQKYAQVDHVSDLDIRTLFSGKFRLTSYTRSDLISLQTPAWNRWLSLNQVDALRNTTFNINDPFTWNYSECEDLDGQTLPGHWRGIYFYFYDTDQPHVSPWHMLGFSQKPNWWDSEYGAAPYTRGNTKLWQDLELGRIRSGARAGTHAAWARPGLHMCIPVNDAGELLPPLQAGVILVAPSVTQASADWKFGDRGPLEHVWLTSVDADQLWSQWGYLARPAAFIENLWDGTKRVKLFPDQTYSQWVNSDHMTRPSLSECVVHRENPSQISSLNLKETYYGSCGIQHWFSEKLVNESRSVTNFLGNVIRGSGVNLVYKMGGFTDGNNIRVLVDSFGLTNVDNLLIPQEDVVCQLLRSTSTQEFVYTGVLIEFLGRNKGWRVIGYDARDPFFEIIPSRTTGAKQTVVVEKQQVIEYKQGENRSMRVPYGTVFETRQQVYDFLISLGRAQQVQGWQFDEYDATAGKPRTWSLSAREFLYWSQGPWSAGTYITLSPLATMAKFKTDFGIIQHIGGLVNGTHSVTDRLGNLISLNDLDFLRIDDEISVKVLSDTGIYGLRLYTTSLEHALVFNNQTVFGDSIYDPRISQRQMRFKLFGYRTLNWKGRLQAPGYLVTQTVTELGNNLMVNNRILPNLEKSAEDLRKIFEIDLSIPFDQNNQSSQISQALPSNLIRLAQHQIGFQPRSYLTDLQMDTSAEFQFYQGMIQQKGTAASVDALLRNLQVVKPDQEFYYFEEWAVRSAQYGSDADVSQLDVILPQSLVTSDPQLVELLSDKDSDPLSDNQITVVANDARTVFKTATVTKFKLRSHYGSRNSDLPTAGVVFPEEVKYQVVDQAELMGLFAQVRDQVLQNPETSMMAPGDRVWQYIDPLRGWNVWKICACAWSISSTESNVRDRTLTTIVATADHNLKVGDLIVIYGVVNAGVNINDTFEVITVWDSTTFDIKLTTTGTGTGGTVWQYVSVRFESESARDLAVIPGEWQSGDLSWVDGTDTTPWKVFVSSGRTWFETRSENLKTDLDYIAESRLYDLKSLKTLQMLTLWDPVKNKIPGALDKEISYKTAYDPAQYTDDPTGTYGTNSSQAWGEAQVGQVWWDLSTTRFLAYEMGTDTQRRQNWGKIAPGTSVDIYEWVRSPVPPASWQDLVAQSADLTNIGSPGAASGQVRSDLTPYVTGSQLNSSGASQTIYYFWVRNSVTVPQQPNRRMSTRVLAQSLSSPENLGLAWWAPISASQTLIGNVGPWLNHDQTVWQTKWLNVYEVENVHREYEILSENDPRSSPPSWLWKKLGQSLCERDAFDNPLPDPRLPILETTGIWNRPRQNMFLDTISARKALIQTVNTLLLQDETPPLLDPSRQSWRSYFETQEAEPPASNVIAPVKVATTLYQVGDIHSGRLNAYLRLNPLTQVSELLATQPGTLILDGVTCELGDRVLVKNQQDQSTQPPVSMSTDHVPAAENGIYVVTQVGNMNQPWCLQRAPDLQLPGAAWAQAQVTVSQGMTQANSVWNQTNSQVLVLDQDEIIWQPGPAQPLWIQTVNNMGQLHALDYTLPVGSQVLVKSDPANLNKWTIWRWSSVDQTQAQWELMRSQSFNTTNCWTIVDWYAPDFDSTTLPKYVWDTLKQRDAFLAYEPGDLVKVTNTGNNTWALYERTRNSTEAWKLVGVQSGNLQLSDNLWDYNQFNLGFGAQGFGSEILGAEYDTRLELEQIWQGLWVNAQGTQGLLKINNTVNEANKVLFVMINHVLSEQQFVDWVFKTSFISMRGLAEVLSATELYTENNINSLISYINETKPYHVKLRSLVDWRKASDTYTGNFSDFDKPPYADMNQGIRILQEQVPGDQVILSTNPAYSAWYQNFILNPDLVRSIKTRMIYDRVSCGTQVVYEPGYTPEQVPDITCSTLGEWLQTILVSNLPVNTLAQVQITGAYLLIRNENQLEGLSSWNIQPWGLDFQGQISLRVYQMQQVLDVIQTSVSTGYTVGVYLDDLQNWNWFVKQQTQNNLSDWRCVAYQSSTGAAQRIANSYAPTINQPSADAPGLISGCESKLTSVSGQNFQTSDSWDQNAWDYVKGWDYDQQGVQADVTFNSGGNLKYQLFVGDNVKTEFSLSQPPQYPSELQVWVDGRKTFTPQDWIIENQISQLLVVNSGVGYAINDVVEIAQGQFLSAAKLKVTQVSATGAINQLQIIEPGQYLVAPTLAVLPVSGGSGVNASVTVRWVGSEIKFLQAPGIPVDPRPNIWIIEKGETFNPALATLLDTTLDGAGLNRPHLEGNHPEELVPVWPRYNLIYDVYTAGTSGAGVQLNQVYESDGIRTHFELPAPIAEDQQLFVFVNGVLQTHGAFADYVINYQYPQVVFVNAPAPGRVNIQQLTWGGATPGVGTFAVSDPGANYQLFDVVTLETNVPTAQRPQAQIVAVRAVGVIIQNGGSSYLVGDKLLYKFGLGTQTLVVEVKSVINQAGLKGVIDQVEIISSGNYTDLSVGIDDWFTSGMGTGAKLTPVWGAEKVYMINRGALLEESQTFTQLSVTSSSGGVSSGTGLRLNATPAHIVQQVILQGDGHTNTLTLSESFRDNSVWITNNGQTILDYDVDSSDDRILVLRFTPAQGDVVIAQVYKSGSPFNQMFARKRVQVLSLDLPNLTYDLSPVPGYSVTPALNTDVFRNGLRLLQPPHKRYLGNGSQTNWPLNVAVTDINQIRVWFNSVLVPTFEYSIQGGNSIQFVNAPPANTDILIEVKNPAASTWDYVINGSQIVFESGVLSASDQVQVITYAEDSSMKWCQDDFEGSGAGTYMLSRMPTDFGSVQVYVDGVKQDHEWDYQFVQISNQLQVKFGSNHTHTSANMIVVRYVVHETARAPVAFRLFQNLFGDTKFYRLSDTHRYKLSESVSWNAEHIYVQSGQQLPSASVTQPGSIWLGPERVEYTEIMPDPMEEQPYRHRLSGLRRGTLGTPTGIFTDVQVQFHNGDGATTLFPTAFADPLVRVNSLDQVKNLHYVLEVDPPGFVSGIYVRFLITTSQDFTPMPGDRNVCFIDIKNSLSTGSLSHSTSTWAKDATKNQEIPGSYLWPYGDRGIQYSLEPQTEFLLAEPGTRTR